MGKFSENDIVQLRESIYVDYVSEREVSFTEEFKRILWEQKKQGKNAPAIFREYGIDPQILGYKRIENLIKRLRAKSYETEVNSDSKHKALSLEDKVRQLEHQLAYTQQEVELLKKIQMANTEARKQWESKHRPM